MVQWIAEIFSRFRERAVPWPGKIDSHGLQDTKCQNENRETYIIMYAPYIYYIVNLGVWKGRLCLLPMAWIRNTLT